MQKIAEQPLMDYLLAMQGYVMLGDLKTAKVYAEMVQELLQAHADKVHQTA